MKTNTGSTSENIKGISTQDGKAVTSWNQHLHHYLKERLLPIDMISWEPGLVADV